jgi:hypothetical protein
VESGKRLSQPDVEKLISALKIAYKGLTYIEDNEATMDEYVYIRKADETTDEMNMILGSLVTELGLSKPKRWAQTNLEKGVEYE